MRTFVAIALPADVRQELADLRGLLDSPDLKAKWVSRENIHLTLKFIGSVESASIAEIEAALRPSMRKLGAFHFTLGGVGSFPSASRPRVIWAGVVEGGEQLRATSAAVERALADIGFPREKKGFSGHVTLARVKSERTRGGLAEVMKRIDYRSRSIEVSQIGLMRSDLTPHGPIYTRLAEIGLGSS